MPEPPRPGAGNRRDPNLIAMLSFFLLLLAFFILLNALSKLEDDRARMVIKSVNEAFNGRVQALESLKPNAAGLGPLAEAEAVIGELRKLFDSMIPAVKAERAANGPTMRLELSADLLFRAGSAKLQPGRGPLLRRIAKALLSERANPLFFDLEFLHGLPAAVEGEASPPGRPTLEMRRMAVLAKYLVKQGIPASALATGVIPNREGVVQMVIQIYDQKRPGLDFSELAE